MKGQKLEKVDNLGFPAVMWIIHCSVMEEEPR